MSGGLALAGLGGLSLLLGPDGLRDAYGQIKCGALPDPPESTPAAARAARWTAAGWSSGSRPGRGAGSPW
nr:hypothetical protein GCM10020093_055390 [Planobispora longispora]